MTPYAHIVYQQTAANALYDKERLVVMVYEGIVDFLRQARQGIQEGEKARKGEAISSIMALLTELDCALDREAGGDMALNLADLYQWMMGRLTEANLHDDMRALKEVENVALELMEGFQGAARQLAGKTVQPGFQTKETTALPHSAAASIQPPSTQTKRLNCAV